MTDPEQNEPRRSAAQPPPIPTPAASPAADRPPEEPRARAPAQAGGAMPTSGAAGQTGARPGTQAKGRRAGGAGHTTIPPLAALVLSVVMQQLINVAVPPESYLFRLFRPAGGWVMGVVPALIAFVLIWTLVDLLMKFRAAMVDEGDIGRTEVKQLPRLVSQEPASVTLQRIRGWDKRVLARPVGRRMLWLLHHLGTTDPQRAHELVRHHADLDADAAASGYRNVRLFIWAMPILGFIGTVLGISLAVGGFSDFLTTNVSIDEIDAVTAELGNVASGLSFAFDTTLLGLLAGLVASVVSSGVQAREERLITRLEALGLRIMANMPSSAASAKTEDTSGEAFDRMVHARLAELAGQMEQFRRTVQSGLEALSTASAHMSNGFESSIGSVTTTVDGLGDNLQAMSGTLAQGMSGLGTRVASMEEASNRSEHAMERLSSSVADLGQRVSEYRDAQASLAPVLTQLTGPLELRLSPATPPATHQSSAPPAPATPPRTVEVPQNPVEPPPSPTAVSPPTDGA